MQSLFSTSTPLSVNYEVTPLCNYRCNFCYVSNAYSSKPHPSLENVKRIIDAMIEGGIGRISLLGGEPSIHPNISEILQYMNKKIPGITVVSNGSFRNEKIIDSLKDVNGSLCLSIHGPEELHDKITGVNGAFKRAISNLELANSKGVTASVSFTATKENYFALYPFIESLKNYTLNEVIINRFSPAGRSLKTSAIRLSLEDVHKVFDQIDDINKKLHIKTELSDAFPLCMLKKEHRKYTGACNAGVSFGLVDFEGNLKLCPHSPKPLGNILKTPMQELWALPIMQEYRNLEWLPERCKKCEMLTNCIGGCHLSDLSENESCPFSGDYYLRYM